MERADRRILTTLRHLLPARAAHTELPGVGNPCRAEDKHSSADSTDVVEVPEGFLPAHVKSRRQYEEMWRESVRDPTAFWGRIASEFHWERPWDAGAGSVVRTNLNRTKGPIRIEWFKGGYTNVCYNAVDRHVAAGRGAETAVLWEGNDPGQDARLTYSQLLESVCQVASFLRSVGVKKGDTVAIYMPMLAELPIAMLACARIGAIHSVVFAGFSAESLAGRVADCRPRALLTCSAVKRGARALNLKEIVDRALDICAQRDGFHINVCVVYDNSRAAPRHEASFKEGRDVWWQDVIGRCPKEAPVEWLEAEDPLFMLYTSGSTGKPKGVLHTVGGYMVYAATTFKYVFDYRPGDVFWCTADCGWITGHTYITYGPLLNGAAIVVFEGVPTFPDPGRCWSIVDKYQVAIFYTAPTAIRSLQAAGDQYVTRHSRKSLRVLGTVGEPINPRAWHWYAAVVGGGRCPVVDTWWQTETGGVCISPLPGAWPLKPGSATLPFFGVEPVVLDQRGEELEGECEGILCMRGSWPGIARTLRGDHGRFSETYFGTFPGLYATGDGCRRDADGYIWLTGRVDDVINVSGHRISTGEVEAALGAHPACAEAAVVAIDHDVKGQGIYAFVVVGGGSRCSDDLRQALVKAVRSEIGAFAAPDVIHWASGLPKTRSGKIMRRILRKIAAHKFDELGDTSSLADPSVVDDLIQSKGK